MVWNKLNAGVTLYIHDSIKATEIKEFSVAINDILESITAPHTNRRIGCLFNGT